MGYQTDFWGSLDLEPVLKDDFCLQAHLRELINDATKSVMNDIILNVDGGAISINGTLKYEENFIEVLQAIVQYLDDAGVKASGTITGEGSDAGGDYWRYVVKDNEYERLEGTVTYS